MTNRNDQILEYLWDLIQFIHRGQNFGQSEEFSVIRDEGTLIKIKSLTKINFRDPLHQEPEHYLPGLSLQNSILIEVGEWHLEFESENDRVNLEISNYEFVEDVALSKTVSWDDPCLSADDIESLLTEVDPDAEVSLLLETYGDLNAVDFSKYPNVLRPYLIKWIELHHNA